MDVRIREQALPGVGHRYELLLERGRRLIVVVQRDGGREVAIGHGDTDEPVAVVSLSLDQAVATAALLTGARFSIEADGDAEDAEDVAVETVTLGERSPAIGRLVRDVPLLADSDAAILAVIRDDTPELIEDQTARPCEPGDRIVVAARRERLGAVVEHLVG